MAKVQRGKLQFSRELRKQQTDAESALWKILRSRGLEGFKFRRQRVIGPFIADFCCLNPKVVIELDGSQHMERTKQDESRTEFLMSKGFRVVRFWDNEVLTNAAGVVEVLLRALTPALSQSPNVWRPGEGG